MMQITATANRPMRHGTNGVRAVLAALMFSLLGACSTLDELWLGESEAPPLPGERISILALEQSLTPDPELAGQQVVLPRPFQNPDWPQAGGYANHAMHHLAVRAGLGEAWDVDIGEGSDDAQRLIASPVVAGGRLFTMDSENTVTAFRADTGARLWRHELTPEGEDSRHFSGGIAVEDGRVYVATGFAQVIALDAKSGKLIWRRDVSSPMRAAPTARGGRVFVVTLANTLHALAGNDGRTLWIHSGAEEGAILLGAASPAVDNGVIVAPFSSGEIVALKVENGRELWTDSLASTRRTDAVSTLAQIRGRPVIDRGRVIAVSHAGRMAAFDLVSGRRLWEKSIGSMESPWVVGNYIYVITNDQELVALSRETGGIIWVTSLPRYDNPEDKTDPIFWAGPVLVTDRLLLAGSDGRALAASPYTGKILGSEDMPDGVTMPPIVANGTVYFLANNADIIAYR